MYGVKGGVDHVTAVVREAPPAQDTARVDQQSSLVSVNREKGLVATAKIVRANYAPTREGLGQLLTV